MKHIGKSLFFYLTFLSASYVARADILLEAGIHAGGDEMVKATFTSGKTESIDAGAMYSLSAGAAFDVSKNVEGRVTIGLKKDSISASNGGIDWERYPLNVLFLYKTGGWRFGGGITYHLNPKLKISGAGSLPDVEFDDALGLMGELDYFFTNSVYVGAQFTSITYNTIPTAQVRDVSYNGNSAGVVIGARF